MHLLSDRRKLRQHLATLYNTFKPDIVIVEPSGVAIPWGLKRAAEYSEEEMPAKIEHAPVVTLVDAMRIDELLQSVRRLVETQITGGRRRVHQQDGCGHA